MDWFIDNGPENEWSPKAKQDKVLLKWYPIIKKIKKRQALGVCIMKQLRLFEDPQPGLLSDA
jgi:hypothetical protein